MDKPPALPLSVRGPSARTPSAPEGGDYAILDANGEIVAETFFRSNWNRTHDSRGLAELIVRLINKEFSQ